MSCTLLYTVLYEEHFLLLFILFLKALLSLTTHLLCYYYIAVTVQDTLHSQQVFIMVSWMTKGLGMQL